ncbi:MAG: serine/threonine protein kinase, partial [Pyrinomonadaceae bacterium]
IQKHGRFRAAEALALLSPILSVLETAHEMGVVHRDLKPENIMVGRPEGNGQPVIKLLDLGIAKLREIAGSEPTGTTALTMAGQVLGTPYYMSPEQWGEIPRDQDLEIDGRADIYSLGLLFYEMIAGRRCYSGTTLHELRREHVSTTAPPLHEVVSDVPRGFSNAIARATAKDRGDRQATAKQFAEELQAGVSTDSAPNTPAPSFAETITIDGGLETNADVNAPTIVTLDPSSTSEVIPRKSGKSEIANETVTIPHAGGNVLPTVAEPAPVLSETVAEPRRAQPTAVPPKKSKAAIFIGLGLVVVIGLVTIGGVLFWLSSRKTSLVSNANAGVPTSTLTTHEVARYWLEILPSSTGGESTRVAGVVPINSGQSLKMHFSFPESGFVYIVGPAGDTNQPTPFLTNQPAPESGLKTNEVKQGADFVFPGGIGQLTLDKQAGQENYTIVFSKTRLTTPVFFNAPALQPLNQSDQAALQSFIVKYKQSAASTTTDGSDNATAVVKAPASGDGNPIVFDLRIQHK